MRLSTIRAAAPPVAGAPGTTSATRYSGAGRLAQRPHGSGGVAGAEHGLAGDQDACAGGDDLRRRGEVDAAVDLDRRGVAGGVEQGADAADLVDRVRDE